MKKVLSLLSLVIFLCIAHVASVNAVGPNCLNPILGGTGLCSATSSNIGQVIGVSNVTTTGSLTVPIFGFVTSGSGGGSVSTSSVPVVNQLTLWTGTSGTIGNSLLAQNGAITGLFASGTFNASGTISQNGTALVLQSRNVNSGGILSGGGDLLADRTITLTTSTLYQQFSASSPVSFNTSTGVLSWSNSLGFLTNASITATSPITWSAGNVIACATCGSGTITSSTALTSGQIDVSSGAGTIANDANFTWASSTQLFTVAGTSTIMRLSVGTSTAPASTDVLTLQATSGNLINAKNGSTAELSMTSGGLLTVGGTGNLTLANNANSNNQLAFTTGGTVAARIAYTQSTPTGFLIGSGNNWNGTASGKLWAFDQQINPNANGAIEYNTLEFATGLNQVTNAKDTFGITRDIYIHPTLTAGTTHRFLEVGSSSGQTYNLATSTTQANLAGSLFSNFTVGMGTSTTGTVTNFATVQIGGAPAATVGSTTITNSIALYVSSTPVSASTTNAYGAFITAPTGAATNVALTASGSVQFSGISSITTPSIGGGALLAGACASATSSVDTQYTSSTTAFITTPQNDLGTGFEFYSFLSSSAVITTRVCAEVAGTPSATAYVIKIIK